MPKLDFIKKIDKNTLFVGIAIVAILITGGLIFANSKSGFSVSNIFGMSDKQIAQKAIDYINSNQLASTPVSLGAVSEESGLIKVQIKIDTRTVDSYVTKDGKLLFPQVIAMTAAKTGAATTPSGTNANTPAATPAQPSASLQKSNTPLLEAYVVSSCPFGLQMQRAIVDAVKNVPALAQTVKIRYIGAVSNGAITSMHGPEEAQENLRQICIREEQPAKYWNYIGCYMQKTTATAASGMPLGDSPSCQASTGVDTTKLNACVSDPKRGLAYAQADFNLDTKYNISGSPTLVLNGAQVSENNYGGRSADAIKAMVCAGSTTQSSYCSTKLNTAAASTSFAVAYSSGAGSAASNNNCAPVAQ